MIQNMALIASILLPLCNLPLIYRIIKRKSSDDMSLTWAIGVWICIVMMFPAGVTSSDFVWKVYTIINFVLFSAVVVTILIYHKPKK